MTDAQNRRIEDKRAEGSLNWDDLRASALTVQLAPARPADRYAFTVTPRAEHVGGGWRLQLFEDGQEVGGGVYPVTDEMTRDDAYAEAMADGEAWMSSRGTDAQVLPKDQGALAEPVAWAYECLQTAEPEVWAEFISRKKPWSDRWTRNTMPLYASQPVAPSAASIEGLTRYWWTREGMETVEDKEYADTGFYVAADVERLLATQSAKQGAQPGDFLPRRDAADEIVLLSNVMRDHPQLKSVIGREALLMRCVRAALMQPTASHAAPEQAAQVQADVRDAILEEAAVVAESQNRVGYEWVRDSLWDNIIKRVPAAIRAMKSKRAASTDGDQKGGRHG